jgi:hypothetical protein
LQPAFFANARRGQRPKKTTRSEANRPITNQGKANTLRK